jgi:hypothetical protein
VKIVFLTVAESVLIDSLTNRMSIINLLEQVHFEQFPSSFQDISFLAYFEREDGDKEHNNYKLKIELNGKSHTELGFESSFAGELRSRTVVKLAGMPITEPGKLSFSVMFEDRQIGMYDFDIFQSDGNENFEEIPVSEES